MQKSPQDFIREALAGSEGEPVLPPPNPKALAFERNMMLQGSRSEMPVDVPRFGPDDPIPPMSEHGYTDEQLQRQPSIDRIMNEMRAEKRLDYNDPEEQQQELIRQVLGKQEYL